MRIEPQGQQSQKRYRELYLSVMRRSIQIFILEVNLWDLDPEALEDRLQAN